MPPTKVVLASGSPVRSPKLTVDFIDVGQGNAVLVSYPNGAFMLADCGSQGTSLSGTPYKHAEQYINTVTGGTDIACVAMSHGDDDHCAFIPDITRAQNPTYVHYGGKIGDYSSELKTWLQMMGRRKTTMVYSYEDGFSRTTPMPEFGSPATAGEAHVSVLSASYGDDPNTRSLVLMIHFGDQAVILPGDGTIATEAYIFTKVTKTVLKECTVLMPGHHGALESTGDRWAKTLEPILASISASGTNMSYAHPSCLTNEVLQEYVDDTAENHNIVCSDGKGKKYATSATTDALLVTATNGDIRYQTDGTNYRVLVSSYAIAVPEVVVRGPGWERLVRNGPWAADRPRARMPAF